jgi:hypothetical protein
MAIIGDGGEVSVIIKSEEPERYPNDANRLTVNRLDGDGGHPYASDLCIAQIG